jgi:hypothetical protein
MHPDDAPGDDDASSVSLTFTDVFLKLFAQSTLGSSSQYWRDIAGRTREGEIRGARRNWLARCHNG